MSYNLYLDDIREPNQSYYKSNDDRYNNLNWVIVRTYSEFVETITLKGIPNIISFDHDLGEDETTGYDCAKFLVEYCNENGLPLSEYLIHSANPVGSDNIRFILENYKKKHPFS